MVISAKKSKISRKRYYLTAFKLKNNMKKFICILILIVLSGCASAPQIVIDPQSITDMSKHNADMTECKAISEGYDASAATGGTALLGAGLAVGTVAAVLATGGLYLLVPGIAIAGGGGAAVGGGIGMSKENSAKERIWADCMNGRGYKAFTSR